jgi:hypothetical protein
MSKARHKSRRPKTKRNRRIPTHQKELVVQLREMGHTYNEIANKAKLGYGTVENICTKWAPANPDNVKKARAEAMEQLAAVANEKAKMALDHITPDSLTHDRIVHTDDEGNITGVSHSGPTAMQIATASGILIDKSQKLQDRAAIMRGETPASLGPGTLTALLESIKGKVTRLSQYNADIDTGAIQAHIIELEDRADAVYADADYQEVQGEDDE